MNKRILPIVILIIFIFAAFGCTKKEVLTPSQVVQSFADKMEELKNIAHNSSGDKLNKEDAKQFLEETSGIVELFPNKGVAKPLYGAWLLFDVASFEILEEKIDGEKAEVKTLVLVTGLGGFNMSGNRKPEPKEMTFQLMQHEGRWVIEDFNGILAKNPLRQFLR